MFDDYFKSLRRSAIIITPQQPFFDWWLMHDPETVITDEMKEGEVFKKRVPFDKDFYKNKIMRLKQ